MALTTDETFAEASGRPATPSAAIAMSAGSEERDGAVPPSHGQILRSTAILGGATLVTIVFSIVRYKFVAVALGPAGVGLFGLYNVLADLAQTAVGLGTPSSGVRRLADAEVSSHRDRISRAAHALRLLSAALGLAGVMLFALLALPLSRVTFGDESHRSAIVLLGLAVAIRVVAAGETALLQGLRRVGALARVNVFGAIIGTAAAIPPLYAFGAGGIVPALLAMAAATLFAAWWHARGIVDASTRLSWRDFSVEARQLLGLGFVFMASGLLTAGSAYAIRLIVLHYEGLGAVGLYQAAWTLGGLYAGFILHAMGTDFYPRLTAVANDDAMCNRLVNEQVQVSILVAGPGLLATLTLAHFIVAALYSAEFLPAVELVRWICLGMMLRIICWPIGFIVLAKGASRIFFWTELAASLVHVALAWSLVEAMGSVGSAVAFLGLYLWHGVLIYVIARRMTGFRWTADTMRLLLVFLPATALVSMVFFALPFWQATAIGATLFGLAGLWSLRVLSRLISTDTVPARLRALLARVGLLRA